MKSVPAKKSLGQNFLKDEKVLQKIADAISVEKDDLILEIGPGKGALTKYLLQKKSLYVAYEIDERMKPILNAYTDKIFWKDFLKSNLSVDLAEFSYRYLYVIANIPYYITTPIIEHLIYSEKYVTEMVLLVQKEVAERFCAKPHTKEYGYFTVFLNYYFEVFKEFDVSRNCFDPIPKVDSTVVHFKRKKNLDVDTKSYFHFLKQCFANKRKTLHNNLKNYDWSLLLSVLNRYGYSENVRAEEIPENVFLELYQKL
jgi:16S rRNA (adenine1518-N6/adenine1519-N6)-dimethyltransferase